MLQLDGEDVVVPASAGGELVVGNDIGSLLVVAQVVDTKRRDFGQPKPLGRFNPAVTRDDHAVLVDEKRIDEAESRQAVGDQLDLALGMGTCVARVGLEVFDALVFDYVDENVPMLARMAAKRRAGYRALGYRTE
jgi:hypothetical protein